MNALLAVLAVGLVFYFLHRMHGQVGGCHDGGGHGDQPRDARPPDEAGHPVGARRRADTRPGWSFASLLVLTLLLLVPLMLLHTALPGGSPFHAVLFWGALLLPFLAVPFLRARPAERAEGGTVAEVDEEAREATWRGERLQVVGPLGERAAREMEIEATRYEQAVVIFEGRLRGEPEAAYARLARSFAELGRSPRLLEGERGRSVLVAVPISPEDTRPVRQSLTVPLVLLAATLVTTTWAGALHRGVDLWREPARFAVGLPYSLALLAILLVHELGHYVAGRVHGINVTLPYFIPVPMGLGTFGAFIQIRGAIPDRRKLFDVGVAGPLAGLALALPALYLGLKGTVATTSGPGVSVSGSVLLAWLYGLANGTPVRPDHVVALTPLGFAGWLGLLVTALNLIPVASSTGDTSPTRSSGGAGRRRSGGWPSSSWWRSGCSTGPAGSRGPS